MLRFTGDDERTYVGEFSHHKMHGKGTMTYPDGHKVSGEWEKVYNIRFRREILG